MVRQVHFRELEEGDDYDDQRCARCPQGASTLATPRPTPAYACTGLLPRTASRPCSPAGARRRSPPRQCPDPSVISMGCSVTRSVRASVPAQPSTRTRGGAQSQRAVGGSESVEVCNPFLVRAPTVDAPRGLGRFDIQPHGVVRWPAEVDDVMYLPRHGEAGGHGKRDAAQRAAIGDHVETGAGERERRAATPGPLERAEQVHRLVAEGRSHLSPLPAMLRSTSNGNSSFAPSYLALQPVRLSRAARRRACSLFPDPSIPARAMCIPAVMPAAQMPRPM